MNWIHCLNRFTVLWIFLDIVHSYNREWIYCILDIVHILKQTVQLCRLSENFYTDIRCDWISKSSQDTNILSYRILNKSQDSDICVLVDIRRITGQITGQITGYSGQTLLSVIVARSDWLLRAYQLTVIFILNW